MEKKKHFQMFTARHYSEGEDKRPQADVWEEEEKEEEEEECCQILNTIFDLKCLGRVSLSLSLMPQ